MDRRILDETQSALVDLLELKIGGEVANIWPVNGKVSISLGIPDTGAPAYSADLTPLAAFELGRLLVAAARKADQQ